ncbi:MAG: hypothetical protein QF489_01365 [Planctomycetota bacterium]|nr:hypothetical protein [Planctomycetota bacterium]
MRNSLLLPLALVAALGACSGDDAPTTFTDPISAMDAGDAAKASGDHEAAKAGYQYAIDNGDDSLKGDAMTGIFEVDVAAGDQDAAVASFESLSKAVTLDQAELSRLIDVAVLAKMDVLGEAMLSYAITAHPDMKEELTKASDAIELIKTQGPGVDLSGLGYAGD